MGMECLCFCIPCFLFIFSLGVNGGTTERYRGSVVVFPITKDNRFPNALNNGIHV